MSETKNTNKKTRVLIQNVTVEGLEQWTKFMATGTPRDLELIFGKEIAKKILRERKEYRGK